jgi:hypothetical protein
MEMLEYEIPIRFLFLGLPEYSPSQVAISPLKPRELLALLIPLLRFLQRGRGQQRRRILSPAQPVRARQQSNGIMEEARAQYTWVKAPMPFLRRARWVDRRALD